MEKSERERGLKNVYKRQRDARMRLSEKEAKYPEQNAAVITLEIKLFPPVRLANY